MFTEKKKSASGEKMALTMLSTTTSATRLALDCRRLRGAEHGARVTRDRAVHELDYRLEHVRKGEHQRAQYTQRERHRILAQSQQRIQTESDDGRQRAQEERPELIDERRQWGEAEDRERDDENGE
jgi:hypothetical protein